MGAEDLQPQVPGGGRGEVDEGDRTVAGQGAGLHRAPPVAAVLARVHPVVLDPRGLLSGGACVTHRVLTLVEGEVADGPVRAEVEVEGDRQGLRAVPVGAVFAVGRRRGRVAARGSTGAHPVRVRRQDARTAGGPHLEDGVVRVPAARAAEGEGAARLGEGDGFAGAQVGDGRHPVAVVADAQGAGLRGCEDVDVVPVGGGPADGRDAVRAVVPLPRLEAAVEVAAALGAVERRPDLVEVAVGEVVERLLLRREAPIDLRGLRHERLDGGAGVGDEAAEGERPVDGGVGAVVPPGPLGREFEVGLDEPGGRGVDGLGVVVRRGHAGLLLVADHVHDRRVLVVVAERVVRALLTDALIEAVVEPVVVVVVDPEPAEPRVAVHDFEEVVVRVLAEAVPFRQVDVAALVAGVGGRVEPFVAALVVPLGVVGHIEDDLEALRLCRRDQLAEEVPLRAARAGDLRRPGAGVAEAAVEGGQDEVPRVQLLGLAHPVLRGPAALGDVGLPPRAVGVLRVRALAPVQEEAGDRAAQELLARVLHFGARRAGQGDQPEQQREGRRASGEHSPAAHAAPPDRESPRSAGCRSSSYMIRKAPRPWKSLVARGRLT